jgi:hypothetical protein
MSDILRPQCNFRSGEKMGDSYLRDKGLLGRMHKTVKHFLKSVNNLIVIFFSFIIFSEILSVGCECSSPVVKIEDSQP